MKYRIGLDIGVGSVGWSVLENDEITEEPVKIIDLGVRTFAVNEVEKTGESTAKARREARGVRRRLRRRKLRFQNMKKLFLSTFSENVLNIDYKPDIYELRAKALDEKISESELERIVLHILKYRGFKSNRKSSSNQEEGKLLTSIKENEEFLKQNGYRTIGEAIYKDPTRFKMDCCGRSIYNVRNHFGDYKNCFMRSELKNELVLILEKQQEFYRYSNGFVNEVIDIFERQRNFDEGPGNPSPYSAKFEIGNCTFINNEKRAPKTSFTFEYFTALSKINSLKYGETLLSLEQKQCLINLLLEKFDIKFSAIRKMFNIPSDAMFNLCNYAVKVKKGEEISEEEIIKKCEAKSFISLKHTKEIVNKLGITDIKKDKDIVDEVSLCLSLNKSDSTIENYVKSSEILNKIDFNIVQEITATEDFNKFGSLSFKAMNKIIPFLEQGLRYDEACKNAGFNHSSFDHEKQKYLKGEKIEERLKDVTSNVVKRAVNQTLRVVNKIVERYGSPQFITIELARELCKNRKDRNEIKATQEKNRLSNEEIYERIRSEFNILPKGQDILKFKLYQEQECKCMYSGKTIDISRLFESNYLQIDHALPYSRSFNDSYNNKVLVLADENQNKGNKTPFEYFGSNEEKWNNYVGRVKMLHNRAKEKLLLKEKFGEEAENDFKIRNLTDTQYMAKFLLNLFQDYLQMSLSNKYKKQVKCVNGSITSYLRKCWNLNKIREDGDIHHCVDATIIATVTDSQIQKITKFNKLKEVFVRHDATNSYCNKFTGEKITQEEKEEYEKNGVDILSKGLPTPYEFFLKELRIRSRVNYHNLCFTEQELEELKKIGYENEELLRIRPVFISRMKNVKTTGAIHKETMLSSREYEQTKNLIKTVSVYSLSLQNIPEEIPIKDDEYPEYSIKDYYRPQDDRLLYLKLKKYLKENGKIKENEPFYKPKKDGSNGPIVKTVKLYVKTGNCVLTSHGAAANDKMYRIDLYKKDNKFYICPVYMEDVYKKVLPNKLIAIGKDWIDIDESYEFMFSLYQNDLIKVTNTKDIVLTKRKDNEKSEKANSISNKEWLLYYNSTGISVASIEALSFDRCYSISSLGVKTLLNIEKYYVDIMGKIYKAPKEERKGF